MKRRGSSVDKKWIIIYSKKLHYIISVRYRERREDSGEGAVHLKLELALIPVT
jgi:hypothetical protein